MPRKSRRKVPVVLRMNPTFGAKNQRPFPPWSSHEKLDQVWNAQKSLAPEGYDAELHVMLDWFQNIQHAYKDAHAGDAFALLHALVDDDYTLALWHHDQTIFNLFPEFSVNQINKTLAESENTHAVFDLEGGREWWQQICTILSPSQIDLCRSTGSRMYKVKSRMYNGQRFWKFYPYY